VDFDDADYGFKEEDKSSLKRGNEQILAKLVNQCQNGVIGTMAQAVEELSIPRIKPVRQFKAYDGLLTLGDPKQYERAVSIRVERYFKTKLAVPPSASTVVIKPGHAAGASQAATQDDDGGMEFSGVKHMRSYQVNDPDAPGGKRDIQFEELAKGYQYGRTVVPLAEDDLGQTKLQTTKGFSILGFIPFSSVSFFVF
jgi:ATP-dependent DNA helicase 2 subunit 2